MKVTPGERIDQIIENTSQLREYVAYLRSYNHVTGKAIIVTSLTSNVEITIAVAGSMQLFPSILRPNARVLIRKVGNTQPLITDVLSFA